MVDPGGPLGRLERLASRLHALAPDLTGLLVESPVPGGVEELELGFHGSSMRRPCDKNTERNGIAARVGTRCDGVAVRRRAG